MRKLVWRDTGQMAAAEPWIINNKPVTNPAAQACDWLLAPVENTQSRTLLCSTAAELFKIRSTRL